MRRNAGTFSFSATEVAAFLACPHLTSLELRVAEGELTRPAQNDIERRLLEKRGLEHEARVLEHYKRLGREIVTIGARPGTQGMRAAFDKTLEVMAAGADLIYQGTLLTQSEDGTSWVGRPDFLQKVQGGGGHWPHHYEPVDAKLSREAKAQAVLQLCAYADQLAALQGAQPARFHIIGGGGAIEPVALWSADYGAYFRDVRRRMRGFVAEATGGPEPYPEPVYHCSVCRYWKRCEERRRADDHLSLVAGITRRQRDRLVLAGVQQLEQLATRDARTRVDGIVSESLERISQQAKLQLRARRAQQACYELLINEAPGVGLEALPAPTPGDLFLDLEGDSFVTDGGLEYLFGLLDFGEPELDSFVIREAPGPARYRAFWATTAAEEKRAFEQVIDRVMLGRREFAELHLYHFGHREADALKKLSCRHATREAEVDQLLRDGTLVDLLPVVRHGLRASVESYSLKELEALHGFCRATDLRDAARAMQLFGWWLETGDEAVPLLELRSAIQSYNRDDCLSTARLRDFLEARRPELAKMLGRSLTRPLLRKEEPPPRLTERQQLAADLAARLSADAAHAQAGARRLLADLLEFHRREEKSGYWEFYRALELPPGDRLDDHSVIDGLSYVGEVGTIKRSTLHRYEFPEQEHALRATPTPIDPDTKASPGTVVEIGARHVLIKRGPRLNVPHPRALSVGRPIGHDVQADSLLAFGEALLAGSQGYAAARSLLLRTPPASAAGQALARDGERPEQALARLARELEGSVIAVQGPPGSGKTYQAALLIGELLRQGKRVGVTANSHAVIKNVLERVCRQVELGVVRALHVDDDDDDDKTWSFRIDDDKARARRDLASGAVNLVGGTAWLWARAEFADSVDALVVDEAGQVSLANALSVARAGRALVLFGDPAQLEQPQKGVHPPGAEVSALEHWLGGDALTIPPKLGVFLPTTRRLHPSICELISSTFYEGRLRVEEGLGLERQQLLLEGELAGSGLRYVPVVHRGNTNQSSEEVAEVQRIVARLLAPGSRFQSRDGEVRQVVGKDVLVVAPYNAQVAALRRALPDELRVGTVDKFQGKEAPVVIYSMTSSSAEDAPRGLEFLFSHNRLNVAVSRAQALCILVSSPELTRVSCRSPRQIKLVNALCAYLERALPVRESTGRGS
jgi:predicted RecB family nuclease